MNNLDLLQEKKLKWVFISIGILGGIVATFAYINQIKHNSVEKELFALDKEIKSLQLQKLRNGQNA